MNRERVEDLGRIAEIAKSIIEYSPIIELRTHENLINKFENDSEQLHQELQKIVDTIYEIHSIARFGDED